MRPDEDDHPLLLELTSLRQTAARFQHEAHAAAIKLQRHSLDLSCLREYTATLEQENARLTQELGVLRAHPEVPPHPAEAQVQELSLALRRVSDKIALTENALLKRTSELIDARGELARARHTADGAYELAARMRAREEACKARERELELKVHDSEEQLRMVDLVVQEYADLVRNLEGRKSANHTPSISNGSASTVTLVDKLQDGKSTLHGMLTAFSTESEHLHATIAQLNARVSDLQMTLDAERIAASHDRTLLSQAMTELDRLDLEDQTAAKMVARYMKFSQTSINVLQEQITTLRVRYASTIATLELQLSIADSQLASQHARFTRLQDALDELCEDLARESYGRRREVALRLALLSREEGVAEFLRRWARRARELYTRCYPPAQLPIPHVPSEDAVQEAFRRVVSDAESLLSTLDDDVQISDTTSTSGPLARIALSREAVEALRYELQDEVQKRVEAIRRSAFPALNGHVDGTASGLDGPSEPESTSSLSCDEPPSRLLLTPSSDAMSKHEAPLVSLFPSQDADSPVLMVAAPEGSDDDPFLVPATTAPPAVDTTDCATVQSKMQFLPLPSTQDSASAPAMLLVGEDRMVVQPHSPAVSMLDLREDPQSSRIEEHLATDVVLIHGSPNGVLEDGQVAQVIEGNDNIPIPSTSISISAVPTAQSVQVPAKSVASNPSALASTSMLAVSPVAPMTPTPITPPTLLSELGTTKHRYDTLQRAFRDCSLALKELKHTLASISSPSHAHPRHRQYLEAALARIDDYAEDARVELEIRVADEELTARGFEAMLSIPGAFADANERAGVEASAKEFVNGTDEGVTRALEKFGKKLEDVQHDVAAVKLAIHSLAMSEEEWEGRDEGVDGSKGAGAGAGWSAWTAGLLGASPTPLRSATPVQTFGAVMTSPRLRHAASLKQLHAQGSTHERSDGEPLAGLNLRIPIPSLSPSHSRFMPHATEGPTRPRTISMMYAVGGLRSSSVGLGVGLGGSPSPAQAQGAAGRLDVRSGLGATSSPLRGGGARGDDADDALGMHDGELGDVE